jgi:hypothetical protein
MAQRVRHLTVAALNIAFVDAVLHDDPAQYRKLIESLYRGRDLVVLRADRVMTIDSLYEQKGQDALTGTFVTMTQIDALAWYNTSAHRPASDDELNRIRVPKNMAANYKEYDFVFFPKSHRLVFLTKFGQQRLSASQAWLFLSKLCGLDEIKVRFGEISITVEQEPEKLDAILDAADLRSLDIVIQRPNAGLGGFDSDIRDALANMGASRGRLSLTAATNARLTPDKPTREAAKVALSNGEVSAVIREEGVSSEVSTKDFPVVEVGWYKPAKESRIDAVTRAARKLLNRIL